MFVWTSSDLIAALFFGGFLILSALVLVLHYMKVAANRLRGWFANLWSRK